MDKKTLDRALSYLDSWLSFFKTAYDFPGIGVAIVSDGKIIFNKSYGQSDLKSKMSLRPDHLFRIASQSKTITAVCLLQLQEQGKLKIDDSIAQYLPWLKDCSDKQWTKVTIRQLMNHGSGLKRDYEGDFWQLNGVWPKQAELKKSICKGKLILDNNTKLKYSNFGYGLLGILIEKVSKMNYADYVKTNIIEVLDLKNTGPDYDESIKDRLATGYTKRDLPERSRIAIDRSVTTKALASATGFYSTPADIALFFSALIVGNGLLLNDESKKEMQRIQWNVINGEDGEAYGLGLDLNFANNRKTFGHGGGFPGFNSNTLVDPKDKFSVAVYNNCIDGLAGVIANAALTILDFYKENCSKTDKDLLKYEGRFCNIFSVHDIVATDKGLCVNYPGDWRPFGSKDDLEKINEHEFKIGETNSFANEGETINFVFSDTDRPKYIVYGGEKALPEDVYVKQMSKLDELKQL